MASPSVDRSALQRMQTSIVISGNIDPSVFIPSSSGSTTFGSAIATLEEELNLEQYDDGVLEDGNNAGIGFHHIVEHLWGLGLRSVSVPKLMTAADFFLESFHNDNVMSRTQSHVIEELSHSPFNIIGIARMSFLNRLSSINHQV